MAVLRRLTAVLALAFAAGCDPVPDPVALADLVDRVTVHALVRGGADSVRVLLARPTGTRAIERTSDAAVRFITPHGPLDLVEAAPGAPACFSRFTFGGPGPDPPDSAGPGCYGAAVPGGVRAGVTYELRMTFPGGDSVRGEATALHPPVIDAPPVDARVTLDSMEDGGRIGSSAAVALRWRAPERAALAAVGLVPLALYSDGNAMPDASCQLYSYLDDSDFRLNRVTEADSATLSVRVPECVVPGDSTALDRVVGWDSLRAKLRVVVYDSAYAAYYHEVVRGGDSSPADAASVGIEGAPGVFAGAAAAERGITLVPAEPSSNGAGSPRRARVKEPGR